jgi:hypothetical protein
VLARFSLQDKLIKLQLQRCALPCVHVSTPKQLLCTGMHPSSRCKVTAALCSGDEDAGSLTVGSCIRNPFLYHQTYSSQRRAGTTAACCCSSAARHLAHVALQQHMLGLSTHIMLILQVWLGQGCTQA